MNHSPALRQALCDFRLALYCCFGRLADALFEVSDALLTAGPLASPVHLGLQPVHRRGWGSLYAALARGQIDVDVRRLHPSESASVVAPEQIKVLLRHRSPAGPTPLFVFDAGYDPVQLAEGLAGAEAAILVRLRSGRRFYAGHPPAPSPLPITHRAVCLQSPRRG